MDKASAINIKKRKMISNNSQMNFPIKKDKLNKKPKASQSPNVVKNYEKKNKISIGTKSNTKNIFSEEKSTNFKSIFEKQNYQIKTNENKNKKKVATNDFINSIIKRDNSPLMRAHFDDDDSPNFGTKNYSINNIIDYRIFEPNIKNSMNTLTNMSKLSLSPTTKDSNINLQDNGLDIFNPKYSNKINKIKDDYIDFLQRQFEDNTKNNVKLDSNNKELLKKCNDLIHDNRLLNRALTERTNKLNKIVQENLYIKSELDKSILNNQKNEQKLVFYEEQFNLFKNNNENYQKIIQELKSQNEQLNINYTKLKTTSEESQKKSEEKYKNDIAEMKKNMEKSYNNKIDKIQNEDKSYENQIKALNEEIKTLKEKNNELIKNLESKENVIDLMYKDNQKITEENNLNIHQIEQKNKEINDLKIIIQHKDNLISSLKSKEILTEKMFFNKSTSSIMRYENSEFLSENITKLISDNEENRMKIEYLNDKIKTIDEIEKKYGELIGVKKITPIKAQENKLNPNNSGEISPRERRYNNRNHKFFSSSNNKAITQKTTDKQNSELIKLKNNLSANKINFRNRETKNLVLHNKTISNVNNDLRNRKIVESNNTKNNSEIMKDNFNKNLKEKELSNRAIKLIEKNNDKKEANTAEKIKKSIFSRERSYYNIEGNKNSGINNKASHGKELDEEKNDDVKNTIREMNRKKNLTLEPKVLNYSQEKDKNEKNNNKQIINNQNKTEKEKGFKNNISYCLYGIDRNDFLHIFDISNKIWVEKKNILEINLDDKSYTFKKDYQYEGTILYNTLEGVYILTGDKTDTLYYYHAKKNSISKICKFNNSHNNGSMMYDENKNCLFVFGGKKSNSCEYYSINDKRIFKLPDLNTDRANASFIISQNKIFGFFGFSYGKDTYARNIEYLDYNKKDKWIELSNIKLLKNNIFFDIESASTMYYKQNKDQILIYSGIQGENEDFITQYYLIYDVKNNTMDKINKWNMKHYKFMANKWKNYNLKIGDPNGFHFAKNSRFILLPKNCIPEGYNDTDTIEILIDYKNNVHFVIQEKKNIDVYRSEI